jgi:hypothetical protein
MNARKEAMVKAAANLEIIEINNKVYLGVLGKGKVSNALDVTGGGFSSRKWIASEMSEENKEITLGGTIQTISTPLSKDQQKQVEFELYQYGRAEDTAYTDLVNDAFFARTNR